MMTRSATFPFSMDPWVADRPREWAELMVDAARASLRLILWFTHARCITAGWKRKKKRCSPDTGRWPRLIKAYG